MRKFEVVFTGRTRGAIGVFYPIVLVIEAEETPSDEVVRTIVYAKYEHVMFLRVTEIVE